jgi:hypothetical protein
VSLLLLFPTRAGTAARTASDAAQAADTGTRNIVWARAVADTAAASDTAAGALAGGRVTSSSATAIDTAVRAQTLSRSAADAAAASDAAARAVAAARAAASTAAAIDTAAGTLVRTAAAPDTAAATDTAAAAVVRGRTGADTAAATDSAVRALAVQRSTPDTASAGDAAGRLIFAPARAASDTATAADTATRVTARGRTAADPATATDTAPRSLTGSRAAADTSTAADTAARAAAGARTAADTAAAVDAAVRVSGSARSANSTAVATDTAVRGIGHPRTATDTASATDTAVRGTAVRARTAADTAAAVDTASTAPAAATLTDPFSTQDTAKWSGFSASVAVTSGRLSVDASASYPALSSAVRYSLIGSSFAVELAQTPNVSNGSTQAFIEVNSGADGTRTDLIEFGWVNGSLKSDLIVGGSTGGDQYITYDPVQHRHLRIRQAGATVYWEVSRDGRTWDRVRTATTSLPLTSVRLRLVAGNFNSAPSPGAALFDNVNLSSYTALAPVAVPAASVGYGVAVDGDPYNALPGWRALVSSFNTDAGKAVGVAAFYLAWSTGLSFPTAVCNDIVAHNETPHIVWEPWDYTGTATQPAYQLADILAGTYDTYITTWAQNAAAWGKPFHLRFAHEMNGNWYPWAEATNGNTAGQYAAAWQHVHDIFVAQGATNAQWVWCPFVSGPTALSGLYPGDSYVDLVGLDGYNWGTAAEGGWMSFRAAFSSAISAVQAITAKPLWICEVGSAELTATQVGDGKAEWIRDAFAEVCGRSEIKGLIWFNFNKERDWRIESSVAATGAFAAGIADARFGAGGVHTAVDTAGGADTVTRALTQSRAAPSTAQAADAGSRAASLARTVSDAAAASDTATRGAALFARTTASVALAADAAVRAPRLFSVAASDLAAAADGAGRAVARFRTASDAAAVSDAARSSLAFSRAAADVATVSDTVLQALDLGRTVPRPDSGTTGRPGSGVTARPYAGATTRP